MAYETLQAIVGTAIVNPSFRRDLLRGSPEALRDFQLTAEETEALASVRANTFHGFAQQLHVRISPDDASVNGGAG